MTLPEWEAALACAAQCSQCHEPLNRGDRRILSVHTHEPICMMCKRAEEAHPNYADTSRTMVSHCLTETDRLYGDVGSYCFHHFVPFHCE